MFALGWYLRATSLKCRGKHVDQLTSPSYGESSALLFEVDAQTVNMVPLRVC